MTPPRETAERIVRNQEAVCLGCSDPIAPWCSTQRPGTPLCRPCQALADAIAEALATETAQREAAERERDDLREWRINVTAALMRPGGSHYVDVPQHVRNLRAERDRLTAALTEAQRERDEALNFIEHQGYRRCDVPACNCGSWHGGHLSQRFNEITGAMSDAGVDWQGTTLTTLQALIAERDRLTAALTEAQRERDAAPARVVAIRQADACRALRQGASPSYVHGVGTCREDAIPRERWCLYCDLAEALNL